MRVKQPVPAQRNYMCVHVVCVCVCVWWCHHVCMDFLRGYMYRYTYIHRSMYCRERGAIGVLKCADTHTLLRTCMHAYIHTGETCIFAREEQRLLRTCIHTYIHKYIHTYRRGMYFCERGATAGTEYLHVSIFMFVCT